MKRVFISYSHSDSTFAERLAKDLRDAGLEVWIDFRSIPGGQEWEEAIFEGIRKADFMVACLSPDSAVSQWVQREIFLARGNDKRILPIIVRKKSKDQDLFNVLRQSETLDKLRDIQMIDFERHGYEQAFTLLLSALPGLVPPPLSPGLPQTEDSGSAPDVFENPFKGLEAFQQTDAHLFFGREDLTQKLLDRLSITRTDRFLAVVGASGSGKSSLVRAGLIPKIRSGALPKSSAWPLVIFAPGAFPTRAMSLRLMPVVQNGGLPAEAVDVLEKGPEGLHVLTESLLAEAPRSARLVLVVDQFEEVFTHATLAEAKSFLDLLVTAVTQPNGRTLAVLTMRADFFDRLSAFPTLARLFEQENLVIATEMMPDEIRRSIELPAQAVGLAYDHGLVDRIMEDVRQQPGLLPLLQYALKELYNRREGRWLKTKAYEAIGGVRGALAGHAETIFNSFTEEQQTILRRLLLRLIEVSDTGEATRRRVSRESLTFRGILPENLDAVINRLTDSETRLLITSREIMSAAGINVKAEQPRESATTYIELSHEALVREWPRLRNWIAEDATSLRYGGELLKDAHDWEKNGRDREYLLSGQRVLRAQIWLENADANDLQREFIEASAVEAERETQCKEQEQSEKLHLAQENENNARRAEAAERLAREAAESKAQNSRRTVRIVGTLGFASFLLAVATIILWAWTSNQADTLLEAFVSNLQNSNERNWLASFGGFPFSDQPLVSSDIIATATAWAAPLSEQAKPQEFDTVPMVYVPTGCFLMGSSYAPDQQPVHKVCFDQPFWIDQFEVSNQQFDDLKGKAAIASRFCDPDKDGQITDNERTGCAKRPRENITWFEARAYCASRDARLPSEAEWEYAARGPRNWAYPWGNEFNPDNVVYIENSKGETAAVGSRPGGASWVGAMDMSGNVWEWTNSVYKPYPYQADDGREADDNTADARVVRGGSWRFKIINVSTVFRGWSTPDQPLDNDGFRCVRDV